MKKSLLLTAAFTAVTVGINAQPFADGVRNFCNHKFDARAVASVGVKAKAAPARAEAKSVYYANPEGMLFQGYDRYGQLWGSSYAVVPPFQYVKFKKVATGTDQVFWHQNTYDWYGECTSYDRTGKTSDAYYSDADGNFYLRSTFNGRDAAPTIVCATDSFTLCEDNEYWGNGNEYASPYYYTRIMSGEDQAGRRVQPVGFTDDHVSVVAVGALSSDYLYGTGTFENGGKTYTCTGVYQNYPKPMAPLWVEDIFMQAVSKEYVPVATGKELKMVVRDIMTTESGAKIPGNKILAELTCTADSVRDIGSMRSGDVYFNSFNLVFTQKVDGKAKGFLIDEPFSVVVYGFNQDGVDAGITLSRVPYYFENMESAMGTWTDESGNSAYINLYGGDNVALRTTFSAMYDYCNPYLDGDGNYGIVKVSDSGTSCQAVADTQNQFAGAVISINSDWKDAEGNANYTLVGGADWVKSVSIDYQTYADYGIAIARFVCDELPADVKTRKCEYNINGVHGVNSTTPIVVFQGEDVYSAIEGVKVDVKNADNRAFNIAGQRVNDNAKGIVVKGGRKFINK